MDNPNDSTIGDISEVNTPAVQSRYKVGYKHVMPSGNVPFLRKLSLIKLAGGKGAPDFLTNIVMKGMKGEKVSLEMTPEDLPAIVSLLEDLCLKSYIWPKVKPADQEPNYDNGEISVDDISDDDKFELFAWLMGEDGQAAISFRQKQTASMGTVLNMQPVAQATE